MVKDHSDSKRGNLLLPLHGLLFLISSKALMSTIPYRIVHTTVFVIPVVEQWVYDYLMTPQHKNKSAIGCQNKRYLWVYLEGSIRRFVAP